MLQHCIFVKFLLRNNPITGASLGRCFYVTNELGEANVNQHVCIVRPNEKVITKYLNHLLASEIGQRQIWFFQQGGGREGLNFQNLKNFFFVLPPLPEQTAIASFLDRKTAQIDKFIALKEKTIALLKERKTAIINAAVTKGLDPNVSTKDSGIEWLGEIPAHWDVKRIGHLSKVIRGASPRPAGDPKYFGGNEIHWITVGDITKDDEVYLNYTEEFLTFAGKKESRFLSEGTLVLTNSGATLGVPKILNVSGCINDGSVAFLNLKTVTVAKLFLYYFFKSLTQRLRDKMNQGATQPNLNTDLIKAMKIGVPPLEEQRQIVAYIEQQSARIDKAIAQAEKEIALVKEYRQALISEAVTGKIRVMQNYKD